MKQNTQIPPFEAQQKPDRTPYVPPCIQTEPLFESNALESAGKSGDLTFDIGSPCFGEPYEGS